MSTMPCPSPCVRLCRLEPSSFSAGGVCTGCWRSLEEITAWRDLNDAQRWEVLATVARRRALVFSSSARQASAGSQAGLRESAADAAIQAAHPPTGDS